MSKKKIKKKPKRMNILNTYIRTMICHFILLMFVHLTPACNLKLFVLKKKKILQAIRGE